MHRTQRHAWAALAFIALALALLLVATARAPAARAQSSASADGNPASTRAGLVALPTQPGVWSDADKASLRAKLDGILASAPTLRGAHAGLVVEAAGAPERLYGYHADDAFQVASALKLLVGSVALDRLGRSYVFHTGLEARIDPVAHRTVLVVHGGGDPGFVVERFVDTGSVPGRGLGAWLDALPRQPTVVALDSSRYETTPYAPGWSIDDILQPYNPVLRALTTDRNSLTLTVRRDAAGGFSATVAAPTALAPDFVRVVDSAQACASPPGFTGVTVTADAGIGSQADALDVEPGACGCVHLIGSLQRGHESNVRIAIEHPEAMLQSTLERQLAARGIPVTAALASDGSIPASSPSFDFVSAPIASVLATMWLPSDNLTAEMLLLELDAAAGHHPARRDPALAIERDWLERHGIDPAQCTLADGSGLSQYDRATPAALAAILQADWQSTGRSDVIAALPVAGLRGTLTSELTDPQTRGRVYAKSGSMMHVRALAGYVATQTHGTVVVALTVDDWQGDDDGIAMLRRAVFGALATR